MILFLSAILILLLLFLRGHLIVHRGTYVIPQRQRRPPHTKHKTVPLPSPTFPPKLPQPKEPNEPAEPVDNWFQRWWNKE